MRRFFASFYRVTSRVSFLAFTLLLALTLWHLPELLNLDALRPRVTDLLETTFHCHVLVGDITAQIMPTPGLVIRHVVFLENGKNTRVLASVNSIHLQFSAPALWHRHFTVTTLRFSRPRIIVHREKTSSGGIHWGTLMPPGTSTSTGDSGMKEWQIRNGSIEIWDHTKSVMSRWIVDSVDGSFQPSLRTGALIGKSAALGAQALLDVHYQGAAAFPFQAHVNNVEIGNLQSLFHLNLPAFKGPADIVAKIKLTPAPEIHATLQKLTGTGEIIFLAKAMAGEPWSWSASGKNFALTGTAFTLPEWSAQQDAKQRSIYARGMTMDGGLAEVAWTQANDQPSADLDVTLSSVTLRQVLGIFENPEKEPATSSDWANWRMERGSLHALVDSGVSLQVTESDIDFTHMHLDFKGTFDLQKTNPQGRIQGTVNDVPVTSLVERFFTPPSPITGTGQAEFSLAFPLSAGWVKGLNGTIQAKIDHGVLRTLKTIYRISAVLNLGNYLRLRLPQVTAQGIEFENVTGHFTCQNGVLSTEDLFLKSPNMNVGAKGSVDIPKRQLDTTLRLEMFRFLEDILRDVPLTHWIFKKPNKIFLPLIVTIQGPWSDVEVR